MKFWLLLLCLLGFVSVACDSDTTGTSNNNNNNNTTPGCLDPSIAIWMGLYDPTQLVHGYCETVLRRTMTADSWRDDYYTTAEFCVSSSRKAAVEYLSVNGVQLRGDSSLYLAVDKLDFNTYHVWSFGGGDVPPTQDSILAPNAYSILSPGYLDTVSKRGFTVTYERPGTDSVQIYFIWDPTLSRDYDPTITDSDIYVTLPLSFKATGSANIPSSAMSGNIFVPPFPNKGVIRMYVRAYRKRLFTSSNRTYLLRSGILTEKVFFLRP